MIQQNTSNIPRIAPNIIYSANFPNNWVSLEEYIGNSLKQLVLGKEQNVSGIHNKIAISLVIFKLSLYHVFEFNIDKKYSKNSSRKFSLFLLEAFQHNC